MFKNIASQKLSIYVFDSTTNLPKTGDAANLTAYRSLDDGAVTVLGDTSATEQDATNAKGFYIFDLTQGETNGDKIMFSCKSATANMVCLAMPAVVYTTPPNFTTASIDSNGRLDIIKIAGTTQTARDIGASVLLSSGTGTGQLKLASGYVAMTWADVAAPTTAVDLSGTTIKTTQKVDVDTIKTNPVVNAGTITFPTNATLASTTNITAAIGITVSTNSDKTGYTMANSGIGAASFTAAALAAIADALLDRNMATGTDSGTDSTAVRTLRQAVRILRNKATIAAGTLTVTKEDDTTASWTAAITTAAGNPISTVDPT